MRAALLLLFVAIPLLELALLIRTGQAIGVGPTILIVLGTAILGAVMLRRQGFQVLNRFFGALPAGEMPLEPIADGAMLLMAGAFLMSPGLITDSLGLLLLVPAIRGAIRRAVVARLMGKTVIFTEWWPSRRPEPERSPQRPSPRSGQRRGDGPVIEGEFERLDDPDRDGHR